MNKENTFDVKIDYLNSLEESMSLSNSEWINIKELAGDEDSEVRYRVAELLALFPSDQSERLLISMLKDKDYLVKVSACDSLSFSKSVDTLKRLMETTRDKRFLVRGYTILSIGDVQKNIGSIAKEIIDFLKSLFQKESSEWVRIALSRSLYILGEYTYGEFLLEKLNSNYYKNRCCVLSILEELYDTNMVHELSPLLPFLTQRLKIEKAYSVKEHLQNKQIQSSSYQIF